MSADDLQPVTLTEAKDHLVVDGDLDNTKIGGYLLAATAFIEADTGLKLNTQTWQIICDTWSEAAEVLPFGNLQMVSSIVYNGSDDISHVLSADYYHVAGIGSTDGKVVFLDSFSAPSLYPVEPIIIEFDCGYSKSNVMPENLKAAILLKLSELYEDTDTSNTVTSLCEPFRLWNFK